MRKWLIAILGGMVVALLIWLSWQLGYLALILYFYWLVRQMPDKHRRRLWIAYAFFVVTLLSSTFIQAIWMRDVGLQQTIRRTPILRLLAGDAYRLAFWATLLGLAIGAISVWAGLQVALYIGSEFVLHLTQGLDLNRRQAKAYLWDLFLGRKGPTVVVEEGRVVAEGSAGIVERLGGPGVLRVQPGHAVVLESGKDVSRIVGPGNVELARGERVRQVISLEPQEETVGVSDVLTRDRIPLGFKALVSYQIEPRSETDKRREAVAESKRFGEVIGGLYPVYGESVYKAACRVAKGDWRKATMNAVGEAFRSVVGEYSLEQLYDYAPEGEAGSAQGQLPERPTIFPALQAEVQKRAAQAALAWGVKINRVSITGVEVPEEIWQKLVAWWQKKLEVMIARKEADREAAILAKRLELRMEAMELETDVRTRWLSRLLEVLRGGSSQLDEEAVRELLISIATRPPRIKNDEVVDLLAGGLPSLLPGEGRIPRAEEEEEKKDAQTGGQEPSQPKEA